MEQHHFRIKGLGKAKALAGEIAVRGAKNAALKALSSSLLFEDELTVRNVPHIEDVNRMLDLLRGIGAQVLPRGERGYALRAPSRAHAKLDPSIAKRMRASIVLTGPMLARFGRVALPHPGGCVIGERPIDFFLDGFRKMGAAVQVGRGGNIEYYTLTAKRGLTGAHIFLKMPSVTATETFLMAGIAARGKTVIRNAATEPEIEHLAKYLNRCGAHVEGAGTHTVSITGGGFLKSRGCPYMTLPDRIEAGSFLILGALAARKLLVSGCEPKHLDALLAYFEEIGVPFSVGVEGITVRGAAREVLTAANIKTHEYPGFPTDLQAPMTVLLTQARGESMVFETIFEGRLNYVESLVRMGANITTMDPHRIIVNGPTQLRGRKLESPDLRGGLAFIIAAIIARGTSEIHNVYNIYRGYERLDERLSAIGVRIERAAKSE